MCFVPCTHVHLQISTCKTCDVANETATFWHQGSEVAATICSVCSAGMCGSCVHSLRSAIGKRMVEFQDHAIDFACPTCKAAGTVADDVFLEPFARLQDERQRLVEHELAHTELGTSVPAKLSFAQYINLEKLYAEGVKMLARIDAGDTSVTTSPSLFEQEGCCGFEKPGQRRTQPAPADIYNVETLKEVVSNMADVQSVHFNRMLNASVVSTIAYSAHGSCSSVLPHDVALRIVGTHLVHGCVAGDNADEEGKLKKAGLQFLKIAAEIGNVSAMMELVDVLDVSAGENYLMMAADSGSIEANRLLAHRYFRLYSSSACGEGESLVQKFFHYTKRAADMGDAYSIEFILTMKMEMYDQLTLVIFDAGDGESSLGLVVPSDELWGTKGFTIPVRPANTDGGVISFVAEAMQMPIDCLNPIGVL